MHGGKLSYHFKVGAIVSALFISTGAAGSPIEIELLVWTAANIIQIPAQAFSSLTAEKVPGNPFNSRPAPHPVHARPFS